MIKFINITGGQRVDVKWRTEEKMYKVFVYTVKFEETTENNKLT